MKITFITYTYPYPHRGFNPGIERVIESIAEDLVKKGHEIHIITTFCRNKGVNEFDEINGVKIHRTIDTRDIFGRIGSIFSLDLLSINFSLRKYKEILFTSDIIHCFSPFLIRISDIPVVSHFHHPEIIRSPLDYLHLPTNSLLWDLTYRRSDAIFSVSEYSSKYLFDLGISRDKVFVLPNGVDITKFHPDIDSSAIQKRFSGKKILLYIGLLIKRKGVEYLIRCMPVVLSQNPETLLLIVGEGDQKDYLKQLSSKLGVSNNIFFEGFVTEDLLPVYYNACDFFVFPSLQEGFGMVLIEAMACGKTVVTVNDTAIPEIVGNTGILVPPKDIHALSHEIIDLLNNKQKKESLGRLALKRVQDNFTWSATTDKLVTIYQNLLNRNK